VLKREFELGGSLRDMLLRYTQALITMMAQTAACNRHHSVEQQLCRWLLLNLDRLPSNELRMTQELIANMLGVRREGVTEAAGKLHSAGIINYSRGRISVVNRPKLEMRVCECYEVVKKEFDRLLLEPLSYANTGYTGRMLCKSRIPHHTPWRVAREPGVIKSAGNLLL
jgi:hypothetical protein